MKNFKKIFIAVISLVMVVSMFACSTRSPYDFNIPNYLNIADWQNIVLDRSEINEQLREIVDEMLQANATHPSVRNRPIRLEDVVGFNFRTFIDFERRADSHGFSEDDTAILSFWGVLNHEAASGQVAADQHVIVSFTVYINGETFRGNSAEYVLLTIPAEADENDNDNDNDQAVDNRTLVEIISDTLRGVNVQRGQTVELDINMPNTFPLHEAGEGVSASVQVTVYEHFTGDIFPVTTGTNMFIDYDGELRIGAGESLDDVIEALSGRSVNDGLFSIETTFPEDQPSTTVAGVTTQLYDQDVKFFFNISHIFTGEHVQYRGTGNPESVNRYVLGSELFVEGFEDYIIDVYFLEGDMLIFTILFPETYGRNEDLSNIPGQVGELGRELAEEYVTFIVTLTLHEEVILPDFDDEFVREETDFDSVEEFEYETLRNIKANLAFQYLMEYSFVTSFPQRLLRNIYDDAFQGYINFIFQQGFMFDVNNLHDFARWQNPEWTLEDLEDHTAIMAGIEIKRNMILHQIA